MFFRKLYIEEEKTRITQLQDLGKVSFHGLHYDVMMKFFLLINIKMPTIVGILTFMSMKNSILGLSEPEKNNNKIS